MPDRPTLTVPPTVASRISLSVDVALLSPHANRLNVLLVPNADAPGEWELPWRSAGAMEESLEEMASGLARSLRGVAPTWMEQIAAFGDNRPHQSGAEVSVGFVGLLPSTALATGGTDPGWFPSDDLPAISARQREIVDAAVESVRSRMDQSPVAFKLLPPTFTLSQLQEIYELLLGRRLHKASFRRALHAAWLVEPTEEWRSEGRGRPAQLFRYAPKRRRGGRRSVRFDLLGG